MSEENIVDRKLSISEWAQIAEGANNYGVLIGRPQGEFQYSHRFYGQKYYKTRIEVKRNSGTIDIIPVVISEEVLGNFASKELKAKCVKIIGRICTYDLHNEFNGAHYLRLCFLADSINETEEQEEMNNVVYLKGQLCKPPFVKRKNSGLKVAEIFIAVKRKDGEKDYIPCVSWNSIAFCIENEFTVGDDIEIQGRLQSRRYFKKYNQDPNQGHYRITYEVAIAQLV